MRAEGEALQRQNRIADAISKYRQSLVLVPDAALQAHIASLERILQTPVATPAQPHPVVPPPFSNEGRSYTAIEPVQPVMPAPNARSGVLYDNGNVSGVYNLPTRPTTFNLNRPATLTSIVNYHWNDGRGKPHTGSIALRDSSGHAYWTAIPNMQLPAGSYTVIDSDPATWSQNSGSNGAGHTRIEGF